MVVSVPEVPPPEVLLPGEPEIEIMFGSDGSISAVRVTMMVEWSEVTRGSTGKRRRRRSVVEQADMAVTSLQLAVGMDPIEEPYGEAPPSDYLTREINVRYVVC